MNNDLISREDLKKAFKAWKAMDDYYHDTDCIDIPFSEAFDLIDNATTVEPTFGLFKEMLCSECEKRPQGDWNYIQAGMCVCPFCGAMPHKLYKNFCAKCGAKMKGGAE